ncbi:DNA-binding transcriptional regulator [Rathayibacter sp. VKM Ac-2835]|uniref:sugar-binding transcriptional regulator n=1 Tax=Rathayibacter sp. VKM Ac-2835 TaxID=2739043 RepID=UPI0015630CC7|nr:sugar-binding domain-containing protein [Rathayibacter sp. VKM Ac-2835]NRG43050.1 DNA-binding transcriptional regulator [Rathayibacter sp. VKM Ac-2835]
MGPDEAIRISYAAKRFYRDGRTRIQIADEMKLSRFKVGRMLDQAQELGIVRIEIVNPGGVDLDLSIALQERFSLKRALAVTAPGETPEVIQDALGRVAANLLMEIVSEGNLIGFTAGRTLNVTAHHVTSLPDCDLVALGGVAGAAKEHGVEILRRIGQIAGGTAYPIFAPLFVASADTARALRADRMISTAYAKFDRVDIGVVAVGSWSPPDSQLYTAAEEAGIAHALLDQGVVGEVGATLFDAEGRIIHSIDDRSIAITSEQLRAIPEVIAVGGGARKTAAVRAALKSGLIDSLVTDTALAQRLLAQESR